MPAKTQDAPAERGFRTMDKDKQHATASAGGTAVPSGKRSFAQDPALAAEAGRKGGQTVAAEDRSFSRNRGLAASAGRKGSEAARKR